MAALKASAIPGGSSGISSNCNASSSASGAGFWYSDNAARQKPVAKAFQATSSSFNSFSFMSALSVVGCVRSPMVIPKWAGTRFRVRSDGAVHASIIARQVIDFHNKK